MAISMRWDGLVVLVRACHGSSVLSLPNRIGYGLHHEISVDGEVIAKGWKRESATEMVFDIRSAYAHITKFHWNPTRRRHPILC
jgi:hypothetical protein